MELQQIIPVLKETREKLLDIIGGLNEVQFNYRKDPCNWSISQVCQHLARTEELYAAAIKKGLKNNEDSFIEPKPLQFLLDRTKRIEAPDIAKPTDEILEIQPVIEKLNKAREKLFELLDTVEDPSLLSRRYFTHPVFKEMLLIEWVESLYLHEQRHIEQIHEIIDELT